MRFAVFPAHDDSAASARIRAFTLTRALQSLGHEVRLRDAEGADVVFVQKRARPRTLAMASEAHARGALVVYDVDDLGGDLWDAIAPSVLRRMLRIADVVTTDTEGHRDLVVRDFEVPKVAVVPDAIDYYPTGPVHLRADDTPPLRLLWFGNVANLPLFSRYADALSRMRDVQVVVVTNAAAIERLRPRFPSVSFEPWSRDGFIRVLQSCALSVLPHDGSEADRTKSNNRMTASITWGVPAVVSRTPDYERTAHEAGVEYALFSDEHELKAAVERLRSATARTAYLATAQPEVWRRYAPVAVANRFLEVVHGSAAVIRRDKQSGYLRWLRKSSRGDMLTALRMEMTHAALRMKHARNDSWNAA